MNTGTYGYVLARAIDVLCATAIWRDSDVTISAMCGMELRKPSPARWARWLGWVLNHIQANHCEQAIAADIARAKAILVRLGS